MKWVIRLMMVLSWVCSASALIMESGHTAPSIKVVMRTSAGAAVTGLVGTNFTIYYTEHLGTQQTVNCTSITNANDAYDDNGAVEIGNGVYRIDLPAAAVDGGAGKYVSVAVTDETAAALNTYVLIELTPSVNTVLANGTAMSTMPSNFSALDISAAGVVEANVVTVLDEVPFDNTTDTVIPAADSITASVIAADAITSSELAASAATEIAVAIATDSTYLAALANYLSRYCMGL